MMPEGGLGEFTRMLYGCEPEDISEVVILTPFDSTLDALRDRVSHGFSVPGFRVVYYKDFQMMSLIEVYQLKEAWRLRPPWHKPLIFVHNRGRGSFCLDRRLPRFPRGAHPASPESLTQSYTRSELGTHQ